MENGHQRIRIELEFWKREMQKKINMLPIVGAAVGAVANYQLIKKLGTTAMNAYRMRLLS